MSPVRPLPPAAAPVPTPVNESVKVSYRVLIIHVGGGLKDGFKGLFFLFVGSTTDEVFVNEKMNTGIKSVLKGVGGDVVT